MKGGGALDFEKAKNRYIPMSETMFYILLSLREERHGYGIMQYVEKITKERIQLGAGTIYQSLKKLEGDGLIAATQEIERRKQYAITKLGEKILMEEAKRIQMLYKSVEGLL
ncbi:MAG: PadR family transcriptional regulator [Christensenellales bacterium]